MINRAFPCDPALWIAIQGGASGHASCSPFFCIGPRLSDLSGDWEFRRVLKLFAVDTEGSFAVEFNE